MDIINEAIFGHTTINPVFIRTYYSNKYCSGIKQWVAEITGIDKSFGLKREFLKKQSGAFKVEDFQEIHFILKTGKIYQFNNLYVSQGHYTSGFMATCENNKEIITLEKEEVRRLFRMPVKNWNVKAIIIDKSENKNYAKDDVSF